MIHDIFIDFNVHVFLPPPPQPSKALASEIETKKLVAFNS